MGKSLTKEEQEALDAAFIAIALEQKLFLDNFLRGKQLTWKVGSALFDAYGFKKSGGAAVGGAGATATAAARIFLEKMIQELLAMVPNILDILPEVLQELRQFATEAAASVAPYLGVATDTLKATKSYAQLGFAIYREVRANRKSVSRSLNDNGQACLRALQELLGRQIGKYAYHSFVNTASAGAKAGLIAADYGGLSTPLVGTVKATLDFMHRLGWMIADIVEMKKANKILRSEQEITPKIFKTCPLLGCYVLTCSTRSNVIAWLVTDMNSDHWMDDVEKMNKSIANVVALASQRIADARYELPVKWEPGKPHYMPGQIIHADDGDILMKLDRLKQQAVNVVMNNTVSPVKYQIGKWNDRLKIDNTVKQFERGYEVRPSLTNKLLHPQKTHRQYVEWKKQNRKPDRTDI